MQKKKRRRAIGMTLIEILVVLVIMSMVAAAAGFAVIKNLERARKQEALTRARTLQGAAVAFMMDNPSSCPDPEALSEEGILDSTTDHRDPWGNAFLIECDGHTIHVSSGGSDGQHGTEDDVGF